MVSTTRRSESSTTQHPRQDEEQPSTAASAWHGAAGLPHGLPHFSVRRWRYASAVQAARAINAVAR